MLKKLTSRKFLVTIVTAIVHALGIPIPMELMAVLSAWLLGQSYVDGKSAEANGGISRP